MTHRPWWGAVLAWLLPVGLFAAWVVLANRGWMPCRVLPAPGAVAAAALKLVQTGELMEHVRISTFRALLGFSLGGGIGFLLGLANGLSPLAERLLDSSLQMLRNVPHLALVPLVIIWFGIGEEAKVFLVALGVFFPIYLNTFHGVRTVDRPLVEMGRSHGLSGFELFRHVIFPGALPSILVGVRYALGFMWLTLIVAETIASTSGIGYLAMSAREFMQTEVVVLAILLYALLGKAADLVTRCLEKRLLRWHPAFLSS